MVIRPFRAHTCPWHLHIRCSCTWRTAYGIVSMAPAEQTYLTFFQRFY